jgi:hypothetical protein
MSAARAYLLVFVLLVTPHDGASAPSQVHDQDSARSSPAQHTMVGT